MVQRGLRIAGQRRGIERGGKLSVGRSNIAWVFRLSVGVSDRRPAEPNQANHHKPDYMQSNLLGRAIGSLINNSGLSIVAPVAAAMAVQRRASSGTSQKLAQARVMQEKPNTSTAT